MILFYDTNALLHLYNKLDSQFFLISNLTFKQLQSIKENPKKDADVKYKARRLINWLILNKNLYKVINYKKDWDKELSLYPILLDQTDSRIILTVLHAMQEYEDILFVTFDSNCLFIAENMGIPVKYTFQKQDNYTGYKKIINPSDSELNDFYSSFYNKENNYYNLLTNEYLIIEKNGNIIDIEKYLGKDKGYKNLQKNNLNSSIFGKIVPKDEYQKIAIDSLSSNKLTLIKGPAGSGKSTLSLGFLFDRLEKGKIDKIIIFCNTIATQGSAKLGYYPGSKDQKLLDSQIGHFLSSKLGDKIIIDTLINKNQLLLLPLSDIRGFDTGHNVGVYITQAQNLNINLIKLALQRVGEDSIVILDGDVQAQVDLGAYAGNNNGLRRVSEVFRGQDIYGQVTLKNIYRSKIAQIAQKL